MIIIFLKLIKAKMKLKTFKLKTNQTVASQFLLNYKMNLKNKRKKMIK